MDDEAPQSTGYAMLTHVTLVLTGQKMRFNFWRNDKSLIGMASRVLVFILLYFLLLVVVAGIFRFLIHEILPDLFLKKSDLSKFTPFLVDLIEVTLLIPLLITTKAMSFIKREKLTSYVLGVQGRVPALLIGSGYGFLILSSVMLAIGLFGFGFERSGRLSYLASLYYGFQWLISSFLISITEEIAFRGYVHSTIQNCIGFWPATIFTSAAFAGWHFFNANESIIGISSTFLIAIVFCLSKRSLNSLLRAIGFHASWDWGQNFFFGTNDSGNSSIGTLLIFVPQGSIYESGGNTGPEGSIFCLMILIGLSFIMISSNLCKVTNN